MTGNLSTTEDLSGPPDMDFAKNATRKHTTEIWFRQ
jgi:hypothetical protein